MAQEKLTTNNHVLGIIHILLAAFCFALMTFFVRLAGDVPTMQKVFFRNLVAAIIAFIMLARTEEKFVIKRTSWGRLFLRSIFGTLGMIANFWAIDHIGIADANMLNKLSPFFAILMSIPILKEKPNKVETFSVLLAFIGAIFVVKPSAGVASLPALVGAFGGFCAGTAYTYVRKLGVMGERGPVIVMFFSTFSTLVTLPYLIADYHPMTRVQLLCLLMAGVSAAGGQLNITYAYQHAPAREISVFDYTQVVFAALLGIIFFSEFPDMLSIVGYIIIIGTAVGRWHYARKNYD